MYKRSSLSQQFQFFTQKKRQRKEKDGEFSVVCKPDLLSEAMEVSPLSNLPSLPLSVEPLNLFSSVPSSNSFSVSSSSISSALNELPDELIISILSLLPLSSLLSFSQVCKRFYLLCKDIPVLKTKFPLLMPSESLTKKSKLHPEASLCHTATFWGNRMWVHGGHNTIPNTQLFDEVKKDMHYYDFQKASWKKVKARNSPRKTEHSSVVFQNKIYMFGGYNGTEFTNSLFSFDLNKKKWKEIVTHGDVPSIRSAHVGAIYNDKMYIFGGWNGKSQNNDFFEYDFATLTWTQIVPQNDEAVPSPRCSHAGVVVPSQHKLFIFGGCGGNPVVYNNELWSFDFITKQWTLHQTPLSPRSRMKMMEWNNTIIIYGGWNRREHFNEFYQLDLKTLRWKSVQDSSFALSRVASEQYSCVINNNVLYIYGGYNTLSNSSSNHISTIRLWFPEGVSVPYPSSSSSQFNQCL